MGNFRRLALSAVWLTVVAALGGCLMLPVPAKTRTEGSRGAAKLELKSFRSGETTREQAEKQLEAFLVPIESKKIIWARYSKSSSAILWAAGGPGAATGGGIRNWGMHNLFLSFNDDGTVKVMREVGDGELNKCLAEYIRADALEVLEVSEAGESMELDVVHRHRKGNREASVKMTLKPDEVLLEEYHSGKHSFVLKPAQLLGLSPAGMWKGDPKPYPGSVLESLRFRDDKGREYRWSVYVHPADLPGLLRYFDTVVQSSRVQTQAKSK